MRFIFLFFSVFIASSLYAQRIEYVQKQSISIGATRSSAIEKCIIECVGQVNGLTIETQSQLEVVEKVSNEESYNSELYQKRVASATKGVVASYDVLNVNELEDGMFEANVSVKVAKYNKGSGADRLRIAVLPFKVKDVYDIEGENIDSSDVSRVSTQSLINQLVSTRKFTVLDREYASEIQFEKDFIASSDVAVEEMCKMGQVLGADYIVVGVVESLTSKVQEKEFALSNIKMKVDEAGYSVSLRFIDIATKQIKFSATIDANVDLGNVNSKISAIFEDFSKQAIEKIIDNIYPLMAIACDFGEVVLNQGGDNLNIGDKYELFALGGVLKDPYTGESLGRQERKCALVELIRVKGKTSDAKVLESSMDLAQVLENTKIVARLVKKEKQTLKQEKITERKNLW
ncbi:MAG: CsgG/HfaB family protein [Opitutales bacterium]